VSFISLSSDQMTQSSLSIDPTANVSSQTADSPSGSDPFGYLSDPGSNTSTWPSMPENLSLQPTANKIRHCLCTSTLILSCHSSSRIHLRYFRCWFEAKGGRPTAANSLEGTSLSGSLGLVPYHEPLRDSLRIPHHPATQQTLTSAAHPVGSSKMILGGFGFLSRLHGLSIDNVVEIEKVLADGRIIIVNKEEHPGPPTTVSCPRSNTPFRFMVGSPRGRACPRCRNSIQSQSIPCSRCFCRKPGIVGLMSLDISSLDLWA
jgi:hypothetical protein